MFNISVYLGLACLHFAFIFFAFASFGCVILLSETYLYAVYFDEPGLKILKITNRFSGYIHLYFSLKLYELIHIELKGKEKARLLTAGNKQKLKSAGLQSAIIKCKLGMINVMNCSSSHHGRHREKLKLSINNTVNNAKSTIIKRLYFKERSLQ